MRLLFISATLASLFANAAGAQAPSPLPRTPGDCNTAITALNLAEFKKVWDTTGSKRYTADEARKSVNEFTAACAAQFDPNTVDDAELLNLCTLLSQIHGDSALIAAAKAKILQSIDRAIRNTNIDPQERVTRLTHAMSLYAQRDETHLLAKQQLIEIDKIPSATAVDRIRARQIILKVYGDDEPEKTLEAAATIETLLATLDSADRASLKGVLDMTNYKASAYANTGQVNLAKQLMETKLARLGNDPKNAFELRSARQQLKMYNLYGSKAAPIVAQHWLNAPAGTKQYAPNGKVALIMMTAHYCAPCKASYPTIARMSKELAPRGVETIVVMKTFGFFSDQKNISAAHEIEEDRKFYVDEYGFTMPIAIYVSPPQTDSTEGRVPNPNEDAYALFGYPTYFVVGRDGTIRDIVVGWYGSKSEAKLAAAIEKALAENNPG